MPFTFRGMDTFLEAPPYWSVFSPRLLTSIGNCLLPLVLPMYEVLLEEHLLLEHDVLPQHRVKPDLVVR
jgi:Protein of unknown function (DUF4058)